MAKKNKSKVLPEVTVYAKKKYLDKLKKQQEIYLADMAKYKQDSAQWAKANKAYQDSLNLYNRSYSDLKKGKAYYQSIVDNYTGKPRKEFPFPLDSDSNYESGFNHPDYEVKRNRILSKEELQGKARKYGERDYKYVKDGYADKDWFLDDSIPKDRRIAINRYRKEGDSVNFEDVNKEWFNNKLKEFTVNNNTPDILMGAEAASPIPLFRKPTNKPVKPVKTTTAKNVKYDPTYENLNMRPLWANIAKQDTSKNIGTLQHNDPLYEKGFTIGEAIRQFPKEIKDQYNVDYIYNQINSNKSNSKEYKQGGTIDMAKKSKKTKNEMSLGGIVAGANMLMSIYGASKAKLDAENAANTQKQLGLKEQQENDALFLKDYNQSGTGNVNYYKKGGKFQLNRRTKGNVSNFKPMGDGVFKVNGPKHNQGGVKLGPAEVEGGEVIKISPTGVQVVSDSKKDYGYSPAQTIKNDTDFNRVFATQERLKKGGNIGNKMTLGGSNPLKVNNEFDYTFNETPIVGQPVKPITTNLNQSNSSQPTNEMKMTGIPAGYKTKPYGGNYGITPYVMDNVTNLITTAMTPNIPTPQMVPKVKLNTDIDVEPLVDNVRSGERGNIQRLNTGISDENVKAALSMKTGNQATSAINAIRSNEINKESELRNRQATANMYPNMINARSINNFGDKNVQRSLGINQAINENASNLSRDLVDLGDKRRFDNRDRDRMRTQLAMDTEGSLSYVIRDTNAFDNIIMDPNFEYKNYHPSLIREISKKRQQLLRQNQ